MCVDVKVFIHGHTFDLKNHVNAAPSLLLLRCLIPTTLHILLAVNKQTKNIIVYTTINFL